MGGIDSVAIALSESPTIEDFGQAVGMTEQEVENLKVILVSVEQGDIGILHSLGIMVAGLASASLDNLDAASLETPCSLTEGSGCHGTWLQMIIMQTKVQKHLEELSKSSNSCFKLWPRKISCLSIQVLHLFHLFVKSFWFFPVLEAHSGAKQPRDN